MPRAAPTDTPAIVVDAAHKTFRLPVERVHTLKERVLHPFRRAGHERFQALCGVSFAVPRGEFFGVVGRNGSGKSTLLKCMAGIYALDGGAVYVNGRMSAFIELGVGFNPDLAARDNVELNGIMLGLTQREARARFDRILRFAELEDFVDLKLKNYSSGMLVRLAFSVMIEVDADILLIDEVLAVGDAAFQQKCYDAFNRIRAEGRTVVLVSHDMGAIERFCDRAVLLEHGRVTAIGDPHEVALRYIETNFAARERAPEETGDDEGAPQRRFGDGAAHITDAWFEDAGGARSETLMSGSRCAFAARVRFARDLEDPIFGMNVLNSRGVTVIAANTLQSHKHTGRFRAGEELVFRIRFDNVLAPDRYRATPAIARGGSGIAWIDRREELVTVLVTGTQHTDAAVALPYDVELAPAVAEAATP